MRLRRVVRYRVVLLRRPAPYNRRMKAPPLAAALAAVLAAGCGPTDPEAEIRAVLAAAEGAAESRDAGFFADLVARELPRLARQRSRPARPHGARLISRQPTNRDREPRRRDRARGRRRRARGAACRYARSAIGRRASRRAWTRTSIGSSSSSSTMAASGRSSAQTGTEHWESEMRIVAAFIAVVLLGSAPLGDALCTAGTGGSAHRCSEHRAAAVERRASSGSASICSIDNPNTEPLAIQEHRVQAAARRRGDHRRVLARADPDRSARPADVDARARQRDHLVAVAAHVVRGGSREHCCRTRSTAPSRSIARSGTRSGSALAAKHRSCSPTSVDGLAPCRCGCSCSLSAC